jgi:hypothetical protein
MNKRVKKKVERLRVMRRIASVLGSNQRAKGFMRASLRMANLYSGRFPFTQFRPQDVQNTIISDFFYINHSLEDRIESVPSGLREMLNLKIEYPLSRPAMEGL